MVVFLAFDHENGKLVNSFHSKEHDVNTFQGVENIGRLLKHWAGIRRR